MIPHVKSSFLSSQEIDRIGFKSVGANVMISRNASFYSPNQISIGDFSRIDDQVVIAAGSDVTIGRYVHLSVGVSILGKGKVVLEDFVAISVRSSIFSSNDDYSGLYMTNPTVPATVTNMIHGPVIIRSHVIVGAHSVILPCSELGIVSAYGALSLMRGAYEPYTIYAGVPARKIKKRSRKCLEFATTF